MRKFFKTSAVLAAALFLCYAFIVYSADISAAVVASAYSCLTVIIPSLFGYLVLAGFLIKSGLYVLLGKPFSAVSRYIFRIPPQYFSVFLISLFAGYPVGAKLLSELRGEISKKDASDMLCYCYTGGPVFIIGLVGARLFGSVRVGMIIYLSVVLGNLIIAILMGLFKPVPPKSTAAVTLKLSANALIESIESGAKSLFLICAMIVFFAIVLAVLGEFFVIPPLIAAVLEISSLSALPRGCFGYLPQISAAFSFGGVCVILQIAAIAGDKIALGKFILIRIFSAGLSAAILHNLTFLLGSVLVSAGTRPDVAARQSSPAASICLIIMTILLLTVKSRAKTK